MRKIQKTILLMILLAAVFFNAVPAHALSISIHISEKYTNVQAGERLYFEVEIKYPENSSRKDLRLNYEILKDNEVIAHAKVLKAVETQISFIDFIVIPENAETGIHLINVKISDYEGLNEEVSSSFHIISDKSNQIRMYFFVLLGAIIMVGVLVFWEIYRTAKRVKEP